MGYLFQSLELIQVLHEKTSCVKFLGHFNRPRNLRDFGFRLKLCFTRYQIWSIINHYCHVDLGVYRFEKSINRRLFKCIMERVFKRWQFLVARLCPSNIDPSDVDTPRGSHKLYGNNSPATTGVWTHVRTSAMVTEPVSSTTPPTTCQKLILHCGQL